MAYCLGFTGTAVKIIQKSHPGKIIASPSSSYSFFSPSFFLLFFFYNTSFFFFLLFSSSFLRLSVIFPFLLSSPLSSSFLLVLFFKNLLLLLPLPCSQDVVSAMLGAWLDEREGTRQPLTWATLAEVLRETREF